MRKSDTDVIIIGAGIFGLSCARTLMKAGLRFLILEAGQTVGGRIKSDHVDGFILDHGFEVLQTAYPETRTKGEQCLYFSAETPLISSPFLILNGQGNGRINNLAIATLTAPSYSSSGIQWALLSGRMTAERIMHENRFK